MKTTRPRLKYTVKKITPLVLLGLLMVVVNPTGALADVFSDDFSINTVASYAVTHTWTGGGTGSLAYDSTGKRLQVITGDNVALAFSKALPASTSGRFSLDILPTVKFPNWGLMAVRLVQSANTYYQIINTDGATAPARLITKVVNGVVVESVSFASGYVQNTNYPIVITFSPGELRVEAFGQVRVLNATSSSILVSSFAVETAQQHAYVDNIAYTTSLAADTTAPTWTGTTTGIGSATANAAGGSVTVQFGTASDAVDGANVNFNVYYAPSSSWNSGDWSANSLIADAAVVAGSTHANAVTVGGLTNGVAYTFGVRVEDQSGNEDANTATRTATPMNTTPDITAPTWTGTTTGIGLATANAAGGSVTVQFGTASDAVDGANVNFNVYYAPSSSWSASDWSANSLIADAAVVAGSTHANAVTVGGLTNGVAYTFGVRVEDQSGNEDANTATRTATPSVTTAPSFNDDFSTNTVASYAVTHTWTGGGTGSLAYDSTGKRLQVITGDNVALAFSKALPASTSGRFSLDILPTVKFPNWGLMAVRLVQSANTYYQIINTDGATAPARLITKVVNGVVVESVSFASGYVQNTNYPIVITFSPGELRVEAFGQVRVLNATSSSILVSSFAVETAQQHAYVDNIAYTTSLAADTTAPTWTGTTTGIGSATANAAGGSVTVQFGTASDAVDGANVNFNVYYAPSSSWNSGDWSANSLIADAAVVAGSTHANAVTVGGLTNGVAYTFGVRVEDQSGNEDANTATRTATPMNTTPDITAPTWTGTTTGIGSATANAAGGSVTVQFGTASDAVDGANVNFNVYYAPSSSWNSGDWSANSLIADAAVVAGSTHANAVTVGGLTNGVAYTFGVRVEDQSGNEDANTATRTATPSVTTAPSFNDDFSTNTVASYAVTHTWTGGGTGSLAYDSTGKRLQVITGDNVALAFSKALPASTSGRFSLDILPTVKFPNWGLMAVRLVQSANTYYQIINTDGATAPARLITKVVNGVVVESVSFASGYVQNTNYPIVITFSPGELRVEAFGQVRVLNATSSSILVSSFAVETAQQHAYVDNIAYSTSGTTPAVTTFVALGDSITAGLDDNIASDDISTNGLTTGGGFEPVLNNLLSAYYGSPHHIVNEGVPGDKSADGLADIALVLARNPAATRYLVEYGTNDAAVYFALPVPSGYLLNPGDPGYPGTFKANMQQIINAIVGAGKEVSLAIIPITLADCNTSCTYYPNPSIGAKNVAIQGYNLVIGELVAAPLNGIDGSPPDFYTYFSSVDPATGRFRYQDQYATALHPNGTGYQSMANLWFQALTP